MFHSQQKGAPMSPNPPVSSRIILAPFDPVKFTKATYLIDGVTFRDSADHVIFNQNGDSLSWFFIIKPGNSISYVYLFNQTNQKKTKLSSLNAKLGILLHKGLILQGATSLLFFFLFKNYAKFAKIFIFIKSDRMGLTRGDSGDNPQSSRIIPLHLFH